MELATQKRELLGKRVRALRKEGLLTACVFGNKINTINLTLNTLEFRNVYGQAGETTLIDLKDGTKTYKGLVKEIQYDPITLSPIHVSFYVPDLTHTTQVNVPVHAINEELNPLVKSGEALILILLSEIMVECLPTEIPHSFEVDVTSIKEIGDGISVSQLLYDREKVTLKDVAESDLVVKLDYAEMKEVEEVAVTEEEAVANIEATQEKKEEETESTPETPSK